VRARGRYTGRPVGGRGFRIAETDIRDRHDIRKSWNDRAERGRCVIGHSEVCSQDHGDHEAVIGNGLSDIGVEVWRSTIARPGVFWEGGG
jgi:hypothetical protein